MQAALLLLDGKVARRAGPTHGQHLPGAGRTDPGPGAVRGQEQREHSHPPPARTPGPGGAIVTIDAASCQKAIVPDLQAAGADYVLALKRNQRTLHAKVRAAFEEADRGAFTPTVQACCETVERNGGRRERRTCTAPASAHGWRTPQSGPACAA